MKEMVINQYGVEIDYEIAEHLMDDALREEIHEDLAPCTNQEFFDEHARRYAQKYNGEEWVLAEANPQY